MDSLLKAHDNSCIKLYGKNIAYAGAGHPAVKCVHDLIRNRHTDDERLFAIEGLWAYEKIVQKGIDIEIFLFCPEMIESDNEAELVRKFAGLAKNSYIISSRLCERLSDRDGAEGFFMVCRLPECRLEDIQLKDNNLVVVLDGLEKPGNIGTIIRSVEGAGGDGIIVCNKKVQLTHHRLIKASMGGAFTMPVVEAELTKLMGWLMDNGFRVIVTDLTARKHYFEADYSGRVAVVAGNEKYGISQAWREGNTERVIIPMFGSCDSLNVGFATTLVTYEASLRQKGMVKR